MTAIEDYQLSSKVLLAEEGIRAISKYVTTSGPVRSVHYYETGAGAPVLLIHGGGSHSLQMYPLIKALQDHYHLYIPDRPGCGLSDSFHYKGIDLLSHGADFIRSFMDALKLEKAIIIAHSMGGLFATSFALTHPAMVEKLVLIGHPTGYSQKIPFLLRLLGTKGVNKLLMKLMQNPTPKSTRQAYSQMLVADSTKLTDVYVNNDIASTLLPQTVASFISLLENCMELTGLKTNYLFGAKLRELSMPVRFIIGDKDKFDTITHLTQLLAYIKDAEVTVIPGAGHVPWFDAIENCREQVLEALREPVETF